MPIVNVLANVFAAHGHRANGVPVRGIRVGILHGESSTDTNPEPEPRPDLELLSHPVERGQYGNRAIVSRKVNFRL